MAQMSKDEALAFLAEGTRTGRLATASPTGEPHVAPIWFLVDGEDLVFTTWHESLKARQLRRNPRAALTVDVDRFPYGFVVVRGPVTVDEQPSDVLEWATRIAARYVPDGRAEEYGKRNSVPGEFLCRLHIARLTGVADIAL